MIFESMPPRSPLVFANQDLRNRSFRGQLLNEADFSGADLRGCDFSGTELLGANFERATLGQTIRQKAIWVGIAIAVGLVTGQAVSHLISGALGQVPSDRAWGYVIALFISLCIAGISSGLRMILLPRSKVNRLALRLSAVLSAAVNGFYYAGNLMEKDPQWAIAGAIVGSVFTGLWFNRCGISGAMAATLAGAIMGYGAAFLAGAAAIGFLSTKHFAGGILLSCLTLVLLWLTLQSFKLTWHQIRQAPGTLFRGANLTDALFDGVSLNHTDFSNAQGWKV